MNERELNRIAVALGIQPDPQHPFAGLLSEARRLTHAEAGTVYLREGNQLRPAFVQNDVLTRRLGEAEVDRRLKADPLNLSEPSIASYVALTGATVNVLDAYSIPSSRPYQLDRRVDARTGYRTRSMLAMPIRDPHGTVGGVLELINALNVVGGVIPFEREKESAVATLLAAAASIAPA
jgi:GAF domain-containing protein